MRRGKASGFPVDFDSMVRIKTGENVETTFDKMKKQKDEILDRKRRDKIKDDPLVKYVLDRGLISARKMCKIMDCDIEDITDGV